MQDLDLSRIAALAAEPAHVLPPDPASDSADGDARLALELLAVIPEALGRQTAPEEAEAPKSS